MKIFGALGLDIKILIAHFVNFAILFFVLYKFGYKYIFEFMENRRNRIEKGIQNAKDAEIKLAEIKEKEEEILREARKESRHIVVAAEELAKKNIEEILEEAKQNAEKIMRMAEKKIEEERRQIMNEVKSEISDLVISATEKILREKIDSEKNKELIERAIS